MLSFRCQNPALKATYFGFLLLNLCLHTATHCIFLSCSLNQPFFDKQNFTVVSSSLLLGCRYNAIFVLYCTDHKYKSHVSPPKLYSYLNRAKTCFCVKLRQKCLGLVKHIVMLIQFLKFVGKLHFLQLFFPFF